MEKDHDISQAHILILSWFMSGYLECYRQVNTERSKMGFDHSMKQSQTCHTNLAWQIVMILFRLVMVRADQKFDLRRVHPLLKCWAWISLRFWLISVCMYVAETLKYLCSDSLGTVRLFIECFNDRGCFSDPSITVHGVRHCHCQICPSSKAQNFSWQGMKPFVWNMFQTIS